MAAAALSLKTVQVYQLSLQREMWDLEKVVECALEVPKQLAPTVPVPGQLSSPLLVRQHVALLVQQPFFWLPVFKTCF